MREAGNLNQKTCLNMYFKNLNMFPIQLLWDVISKLLFHYYFLKLQLAVIISACSEFVKSSKNINNSDLNCAARGFSGPSQHFIPPILIFMRPARHVMYNYFKQQPTLSYI